MGLKVLVIEDSPLMRKLIHKALRQSSVAVDETVEASNGEEGLKCLQESSPDVILCDWNMPVMDGLEFVTQARTSSTTPIIMLTTEGTDDKKAKAVAAGANGYVTKPFTPEKLEQAIESFTGK